MDKSSGFVKEFWKNDNYDDPSRKETWRENTQCYILFIVYHSISSHIIAYHLHVRTCINEEDHDICIHLYIRTVCFVSLARVAIRPSESANSKYRGMDLFDSQRQGRLRDPASFCKGPICHFTPPPFPPQKTHGAIWFSGYISEFWISYILWSDLTASLSKLMCWKTVFVWDFGPLSQGRTVKHFDFWWVFVDVPGGVIFVSMVNFYLQTPFWWLMVWLITHIYKNLNKSSPSYPP